MLAIKSRGLSDSQSYVTTFMKPRFSLLHKLVFPNSFCRTFKFGNYTESIRKLFSYYSKVYNFNKLPLRIAPKISRDGFLFLCFKITLIIHEGNRKKLRLVISLMKLTEFFTYANLLQGQSGIIR